LPAGALEAIPESPGIYRFYGLNPMPLYVGKSINLRQRVASHFSSDYRNANDLRLSSELVRIEFEETAGELGALLRESQLVKSLFPAYNQRLRRRIDLIALGVMAEPSPPHYLRADVIEPRDLHGLYGPFSSRRAARETLRDLAAEAALCWRLLGLERRAGPCFARQIKKCAGACVGAETLEAHHQRFRQALAPYALRQWPYDGIISIQETSLSGERTDVHLFRDWCWLGSARDLSSLHALLDAPPRAAFDLDIYRILCKRLPRLRVHTFAHDLSVAHQGHRVQEMG
ncbi:MAG TPA: GIY-YIG nuclease family protein, partial [Casimicrobiaceae bacterium]